MSVKSIIPLLTLLTALLSTFAHQSQTAPRAFEAASVKPHRDAGRRDRTRAIEPGRITCLDASLGELISLAYDVKRFQIAGPDWITGVSTAATFDVIATAGTAAPVPEVKRMLGPLLADRFHLAFHRETRDLPVFALTLAKGGPRFQPGDAGKQSIAPDGTGGISFHNYSMESFADWLNILPSMGRPVIDRTGLAGPFTFRANFFNLTQGTPPDEVKRAMTGPDLSDTLRSALPNQLGLRLEAQKSSVETLVIDRADKVPTEN
jgi:uncharacterized protein (TIGR03435 family)